MHFALLPRGTKDAWHKYGGGVHARIYAGPAQCIFRQKRFTSYYASSTQQAQVGGDFYDVFNLRDGKYAVVIGDVSGKGIVAAASTAMVKCVLRTFLYQSDSPAFVLTRSNSPVIKQIKRGTFVTVFCAVYIR